MNKKEFYTTLRLAITGQPNGPNIYDVMEILGKEETIARLNNFIEFIEHKQTNACV